MKFGDKVVVHTYKSKPGKGLSYNGFEGTILEDYDAEGWDVIDVERSVDNEIVSVYGFSIKKEE